MTQNQHLPKSALSALLLAAIPTLLPALLSAQQPLANPPAAKSDDKPTHTLRPPGREIQLAVTVRDKKGALVSTIDKNDFTLTEDGRPQVIQTFARDAKEPWKLGLLIETARPVGSALEDARKAGGQFVDTMLPDQPSGGIGQLFLIHFDRQVELSEDFTSSRDKLHRELDDLSATRERHDDTEGPETTGDDRDRPTRTRNASQLYDAIFLACDELMKNQQGRKAIVVFSDGIDRGSKDTLNDAIDAADRANVAIYTVYTKGQQEQENNGFSRNRRGGIGYPGGGGGGYPGGGGGYPGGGGQQRREPKPIVDGKKIMEEIARRTGGHGYEAKKRDEIEPIYKLISEELQGQYVLTYTPDKPDTDGGFHKVAVKANKGDLQVTSREGYYAPGGDSK